MQIEILRSQSLPQKDAVMIDEYCPTDEGAARTSVKEMKSVRAKINS